MRIDVLTLFPEMFEGVFGSSILGKAREKGLVELSTLDFRAYSNNKHNRVDDYPFGGGGGMVLKAEPIFSAVEDLMQKLEAQRSGHVGESGGQAGAHSDEKGKTGITAAEQRTNDQVRAYTAREPGELEDSHSLAAGAERSKPRIILMCPQGESFTQRKAEELSSEEHLVFICGHYEGYDERIREHLVTDELSIGDYVLTGGELPAMVVIDSVVRLLPGVLGNQLSAVTDSFSTGLLEYPHYTRPASFRGWEVPEVLLSGHHVNIDVWRRRQSLERTWRRRPELLEKAELSKKDREWLMELEKADRQSSEQSDN